LGAIDQQLDPSRFVRIHRSSLLNIDRLARIELYSKDSYVAILNDGTRLPISRSGYAKLQELI
jgi:two-component system LytT family response regulator